MFESKIRLKSKKYVYWKGLHFDEAELHVFIDFKEGKKLIASCVLEIKQYKKQ